MAKAKDEMHLLTKVRVKMMKGSRGSVKSSAEG